MPPINSKLVQALVERLIGAKEANQAPGGRSYFAPQQREAELRGARQDLQAAQPVDQLQMRQEGRTNIGGGAETSHPDFDPGDVTGIQGSLKQDPARLPDAGVGPDPTPIPGRFSDQAPSIRGQEDVGEVLYRELVQDIESNTSLDAMMPELMELKRINPKLADDILDRAMRQENRATRPTIADDVDEIPF